MISRRGFLMVPAGLLAQDAERRVYQSELNVVVLSFTVTDARARYIDGLKPSDLRVYEDGILQRVSIFAESGKPPLSVNDDGSAPGVLKQFESMREDQEHSYAIAYHPAPSNNSGTFRKIRIEIVHEWGRLWRVKHRVGYRR